MKKNQFKALLLLPFFTLQVLQAQNHELEIKNYFQTNFRHKPEVKKLSPEKRTV